MKDNPILSILIPVYNAERFIYRCLDSIVRQDFFNDNVEIVLINDGSIDKSLSILSKYAEKYENIQLTTRENKGIGPTRNELIQNASGRYFWFVDADDYVSPNALSVIIPLLKIDEYDMLLTSYYWCNDESGRNIVYSGEYATAIELTDNFVLNNSLWTRIYRTSIVKGSGIMFEHYIMGEDFDVILKLTPLLGKVKCIEESLYNYVHNPNSAVGNVNIEHRKIVSDDSIRCIINNIKYIRSLPLSQQTPLKKHLDFFTFGYIQSLYVIRFTLKKKKQLLASLVQCGAIPIVSYRQNWKHRLFTLIVNNKTLRTLSFVVDNIYLYIKR